MNDILLSQIHPSSFAHPYDQKATANLEKVPFLPRLLKAIAKIHIEELYRAHYMHSGILLGRRQLPSIWKMVNRTAEKFGMPAPTTYVSREGSANAFAFGMEDHVIILTTELIDLMTDRELEAIIAHELAHILCQHMLYRKVGMTLAVPAAEVLNPLSKLPTFAIDKAFNLLMLGWSRSAEYTADRAALLALGDPEPLSSCLSRLAGVPHRFRTEFDPAQHVAQVQKYEEGASTWSKLVHLDIEMLRTHPEPTKRSEAILAWADSEQYEQILKGHYRTRFDIESDERISIAGLASCPLCKSPVGELTKCSVCGLDQNPRHQKRCINDHPASLDWTYCQACGEEIDASG